MDFTRIIASGKNDFKSVFTRVSSESICRVRSKINPKEIHKDFKESTKK